ncbi:MAG TPA: PspA/IM30 family protein [Terriglobales bacterium]|nr:PspA/IM30 family protein [Terriglobales bacterium]
MGLLERVSTLIRANLNDLIDKAEDPEKVIKQIIIDMQNQLLQVKTQVAIAIADEKLLDKKRLENEANSNEWMKKAEMAVTKKDDELARAALERHRSYKQIAVSFAEQVEDQKNEVEKLKTALRKLDQKLEEARNKSDMLMARHRRSKANGRAAEIRTQMADAPAAEGFDRMKDKVLRNEAIAEAKTEMLGETTSIDDRFAAMEKEDEIERMLTELKSRVG